ncbi:hypothetical protein DFAR_3380002 [Desulfarculales bacterium]
MPQGRSKIEKFFRTVMSQLLPDFKSGTLRDINKALECWIRDIYYQRKHLGTGQAPLQRFTRKRVKLDHHLLRLESSSTTAPTGGSLF